MKKKKIEWPNPKKMALMIKTKISEWSFRKKTSPFDWLRGLGHDAGQVFGDADPGSWVAEGVNNLLKTSWVVDGTGRVGPIERFWNKIF